MYQLIEQPIKQGNSNVDDKSTNRTTNLNNEHKMQKMYQPIKQRNLRLYQPIKQRIKIKNIYQTIIQQLKFKSREKVTTELTLIKRKSINQSIFNQSINQSFNQSNKQQNHFNPLYHKPKWSRYISKSAIKIYFKNI